MGPKEFLTDKQMQLDVCFIFFFNSDTWNSRSKYAEFSLRMFRASSFECAQRNFNTFLKSLRILCIQSYKIKDSRKRKLPKSFADSDRLAAVPSKDVCMFSVQLCCTAGISFFFGSDSAPVSCVLVASVSASGAQVPPLFPLACTTSALFLVLIFPSLPTGNRRHSHATHHTRTFTCTNHEDTYPSIKIGFNKIRCFKP